MASLHLGDKARLAHTPDPGTPTDEPLVSVTERTRLDGPVHHTATVVIPLCLNMCDSNLFKKKTYVIMKPITLQQLKGGHFTVMLP